MSNLDANYLNMMWLALAAALAGWVDAIVGGGGLIQTPAFLLAFPTAPSAYIVGTTKVSSAVGTASATWTYLRAAPLRPKLAILCSTSAAVLGASGALLTSLIPINIFRPIIIFALIVVLFVVLLKPNFGMNSPSELALDRGQFLQAVTVASAVGFYDGIVGAGTGTFLAILYVWSLRASYLSAAPLVKVTNLGSNIGALVVFSFLGDVLWKIGLIMAIFNFVGARLGARLTIQKGSTFIRLILLIVASAMIVRLMWSEFT